MTKTTELAKEYAHANYNEWVGDNYWQVDNDYEDIKDAYKNGAQDMLERVLKYLEAEHPTFFDHFGEEIRKAMEE